ncbi:MAG: twin-arginine translocase TatA/TatE family subunit [Spirochaetales bacterium]|nr:twin-arginine translocase TatA/TatE family subunit [Spirochaetales bacterium]
MIGTTEVLVVSGVVVLLFGASALPKFARNVGKARLEFEQGMQEARDLKKKAEAEEKEEEK